MLVLLNMNDNNISLSQSLDYVKIASLALVIAFTTDVALTDFPAVQI